ncbi:hypothetical protein C9374_008553 [Naegleria lovaniensis]|uniref:Uncharacterized protein n=1 Tax=Naegleria lovaniensis TaxID=51637 RepID=A0AA88GKJ0_NAELO|nr:uncharacterized protein C9374_008553 [Naegleria lovaniensis]KAG2378410.1 hypothetical protein C9374_008553 [Naegleria lovaniensis]
MSVDQIYNALINNDHKAMASFYFSLSDLPQQIRGLNETLTKMDARITNLDMRMTNFEKRMEKEMKEIRDDLRIINTNIGCLYEGQVKLQFQKDDEFITHNPTTTTNNATSNNQRSLLPINSFKTFTPLSPNDC